MKRDQMLRIVVSEEERVKAKALADEQGLTVSAYIRRMIIIAQEPQSKSRKHIAV